MKKIVTWACAGARRERKERQEGRKRRERRTQRSGEWRGEYWWNNEMEKANRFSAEKNYHLLRCDDGIEIRA
jgi:hypothetical protein